MSVGNGQHMKCPCGGELDAVVDSRPRFHRELGQVVARRRKCSTCGDRTTTFEVHEKAVENIRHNMAKTLMSRLLEEFL